MSGVHAYQVCGACGVVNEDAAARIAELEEQLEIVREDRGNLERELRGKRAQIKRLKAEGDADLLKDPFYLKAEEVLTHWQRVCAPTAREPMSRPRLENCIARLKGKYSVDDLKLSCDGYALKPYVVNGRRSHEGPRDDWHADAELIFRSARHVDNGIRIAERADDLRQVLAARPENEQNALTPEGKSQPDWITQVPGGAIVAGLSPLGAAALRYANFGFYVFPVKERGKEPVTPNGLKDAKRDEGAIRACWAKHPNLNVAVRTGRESGIVVLDVDGDEGWDSLHRLEDENEELPTTASIRTPSGGQHFYFLHPGVEVRNTAGFPAERLDIRGDGGYVLAPPSVGASGRCYELDEEAAIAPMPQWLLDLILNYQRRVDASLQGTTDWPAFLANAPSAGERNTRMTSYVGHLFGHGMDSREVLATARLLNAQVRPPLTDKELASVVKSIARAEQRRAA